MVDFGSSEFTRYIAAHEHPEGPDDKRPTALQIVQDNELEGVYHRNSKQNI